ncbi:hypothetical protein AB6A23_21675 [Paenibacillus tarimensis]
MQQHRSNAIRFEFSDYSSMVLAWGTLQELGYSPVREDGNRVHIHLDGGDLTSALEIAMAYGGRLVEQTPLEGSCITDSAYSMDSIPIPAHIVNEDWIGQEYAQEPEMETDQY